MTFQPHFCPFPDCPSQHAGSFAYRRRGYYRRRCDLRIVQRFLCLACARQFSEQRFRLDFRLQRPDLLPRFLADRLAKLTHRSSAEKHGCSHTTEERHARLLTRHREALEAQVRGSTHGLRRPSPRMHVRAQGAQQSLRELLRWRVFPPPTVPA